MGRKSKNRITSAWKKFYAQKQKLTSRTYSLNDRPRLFHGVVTPTLLYGSETWTMTRELVREIQSTQRKMLRMIVQVPHRRAVQEDESDGSDVTRNRSRGEAEEEETCPDESLEPWREWVQRCTHVAEERMRRLKIKDWIHLQRQRKWRWAYKVATTKQDSWILRALTWDPSPKMNAFQNRNVGRPKLRWTDDIKQHLWRELHQTTPLPSINPRLDNGWLDHARDEDEWKRLEEGYVTRSARL